MKQEIIIRIVVTDDIISWHSSYFDERYGYQGGEPGRADSVLGALESASVDITQTEVTLDRLHTGEKQHGNART